MYGRHGTARWIAALGLLVVHCAYAGRPMDTDDADIGPLGECQLQTWLEGDRHALAGWVLPACTPLAGAEVTAGGARHRGEDGNHLQGVVQLKFLLRGQTPGGWGTAVSVGWSRTFAGAVERIDEVPLNLMASYRARDEGFLVHVNVGARRDRMLRATHATWGLAFEHAPEARFGSFVEALGGGGESTLLQTGIRYDFVPQRVSLNLTAGALLSNGLRDPFMSIGLNL